MKEQSIVVQRTANYTTQGSLSKKTKYIWFCFHGYGQTANYMAAKFDFLDEEEHFVICPEGINKFYWHDNNEPVAGWMTRRHRYHEINDFTGMLDALYDRYCRHVHQEVKIIFFGFSQGCATIWRWIHASSPRFTALVNWCGWIPEDIGYTHLQEYLDHKKIYLHWGKNDQFMTDKMIKMMEEVIQKNDLTIEKSTFEGKHHIPKTILKEFVSGQLI